MGKTLKYGEFEFPSSAGFTGSAGVQTVRGYQRGGQPKVAKVMGEFGKGDLRSGSKTGPKVTNPKQAVAIAMNEAGMMKKATGGRVEGSGEKRVRRRKEAVQLAEGGPLTEVAEMKSDKAMIKKAVHAHEKHDHPGKPLTKLRRGGVPVHNPKPMIGG